MIGQSRRLLATTLTLLAVGLTALAVQWVQLRLGDKSTLTGWTLLMSTAGLYLLSERKRRPAATRLGPVAAWLQVHAYMGSFASIVFLMHIGWPIRGSFEIALAACFVFVAGSGIALGIMSRTIPQRLSALPRDYRLELIPALNLALSRDAHRVALDSTNFGEGATLAEYYQRRLLPFFQLPRSRIYRLLPNGVLRRRLLRELNDVQRYLADRGNISRNELVELVKAKDDLDYQEALLSRLRLLYLCHVSLTWALAILISVHVVLVYRFQGAL